MYLHHRDRSDQQRLLVALASGGRDVYYATPEFDDKTTIDRHHVAHTVQDATAFFAPGDIGVLVDNKEHYVAYDVNGAYGWLCSEPKEIINHRFRRMEGFARSGADGQVDEGLFNRLVEEFAQIAQSEHRSDLIRLIRATAIPREPRTLAVRVSYLTRVMFECQLLVTHAERTEHAP
jgi:hypothetical protein